METVLQQFQARGSILAVSEYLDTVQCYSHIAYVTGLSGIS